MFAVATVVLVGVFASSVAIACVCMGRKPLDWTKSSSESERGDGLVQGIKWFE